MPLSKSKKADYFNKMTGFLNTYSKVMFSKTNDQISLQFRLFIYLTLTYYVRCSLSKLTMLALSK